ncbi:guanine-nucleotide-exchange-factor [Corchorus olitorius]|uniref:Guanine-nucleotide-exchange-factor n=1 Tax=Corchorus olitorius TaxID=93759 RepID=A0A1R3GH79_9ROSI|nr:guanine-nucleotide-exchange-factor [Corchorus olitorius]
MDRVYEEKQKLKAEAVGKSPSSAAINLEPPPTTTKRHRTRLSSSFLLPFSFLKAITTKT